MPLLTQKQVWMLLLHLYASDLTLESWWRPIWKEKDQNP